MTAGDLPLRIGPKTDGPRRDVEWPALADAMRLLPSTARVLLGQAWLDRMRREHLAIGAFAELAQELAAIGCDPQVLRLVAQAVGDEARHAELCGRVAAAALGPEAVPPSWRGVPRLPPHEGADAATRALFHVVEMCCLSETLTTVYFAEMHRRASHPAARAAIESLLSDEIHHGRAGWAYVATRRGSMDGLDDALPAMLERTIGQALQGCAGDEGTEAMEAFGYVRDGASIVRRALREVIVPGFDLLGVDLGPSCETIARLSTEA